MTDRERIEELKRVLALAALPLETLNAHVPYLRVSPLGRRIKALSPELEQSIAEAVEEIRKVLLRG